MSGSPGLGLGPLGSALLILVSVVFILVPPVGGSGPASASGVVLIFVSSPESCDLLGLILARESRLGLVQAHSSN